MPDDKRRDPDDDEQRDFEVERARNYDNDHLPSTTVGFNSGGLEVPPVDMSPEYESSPPLLESATRAPCNARITIELADDGSLNPSTVSGENGDVLRDAFYDALRFEIKEEGPKTELKELVELCRDRWLKLEISSKFSASISDHALAELIANSVAQLNLVKWPLVALKAFSEDAWSVLVAAENGRDRCTFEYCLVLRHTDPKMKEILGRYIKVEEERAKIDANRDVWITEEAQPLLDAIDTELKSATMPPVDQDEMDRLRKQLRNDCYYGDLIDSAEAAELLGVKENRVRQFAQEGRIGIQLGRFYVFRRAEVEHFAAQNRPQGRPRK